MDHAGRSLGENIAWNTAGNVAYGGVHLIVSALMVRLAGYTEAGVFALAFTAGNVFFIIATYTLRAYQVTDSDRRFSDAVFVNARLVTAAAGVALSVVFVLVFGYPRHTALAVVIFAAGKAVDAFADVVHGIFQRQHRMDLVGISFMLRSIAIATSFALCMMLGAGAVAVCIGMLFASALVLCLYDIPMLVKNRFFSGRTSSGTVQALLCAGAPLAISGLVFIALNALPRFFLERSDGERTLGVFSALFVPVMVISMLASYIFNPVAVHLADDIHTRDRGFFRKSLVQVAVIAVITAVSVSGAWVFGRPVLTLVFGSEAAGHHGLFLLLVVAGGMQAMTYYMGLLLIAFRVLWPVVVLDAAIIALAFAAWHPLYHGDALRGAVLLSMAVIGACGLGRAFLLIRPSMRLYGRAGITA